MTITTDPHGWPDPARPGYPMHPERDGWHWVQSVAFGGARCLLWVSEDGQWAGEDHGRSSARSVANRWRYLGPCLTPAEVAAAVQAEREACADVAYHIYDDRLTAGEEECAQGAYDAAISIIRARGPADALAEALAQARREGMEDAAALIEARAEGLHPAWVAIMRREVAAIRSAAGEGGK